MITTAAEISEFLGGRLVGANLPVSRIASLGKPAPGAVIFAKAFSADVAERLKGLGELTVLVPSGSAAEAVPGLALIEVTQPRMDFAKVCWRFFVGKPEPRIAATAVVSPKARIGANVTIGEYCVIADDVEIGDGTELRHHVVVGNKVRIGKRCLVKSHAVVGEEGFGVGYDENGHTLRMPHFGGVVIEDDVEIGCMVTVCLGTLDPTIVRNRAKIDDHVHLGHNCDIGEDSIITACVCIGGSSKVGRQGYLGNNANLMNQKTMGDRAYAGLGANIVRSVEAETVVAGNPAKPLRKRDGLN